MTNQQTGLPDFMDGHILVTFLRDQSPEARHAARADLTPHEQELTDILDEQNETGGDYVTDDIAAVDSVERADGVSSIHHVDEHNTVWHRPVIDLDMNAALIPSGTPGHFHLYIDKLVEHDEYMGLLSALADAGIIERGYDTASQERGYSSARLPTKPKVVDFGVQPDADRAPMYGGRDEDGL
jgi:hypothetical protein